MLSGWLAQPSLAFRCRQTQCFPLIAGLKVIVIGGGVAGLKSAGDLQRGGAEVVVLEARER